MLFESSMLVQRAKILQYPQTIQIFLPSGDPQGIRVAEMSTRVVRVIEVPRKELPAFLEMPDARGVGLYLLVGKDEMTDEDIAYIGQTGQLLQRLGSHDRSKDFWQKAVVVTATNGMMTGTHVAYLEHLSINLAKQAGRYRLTNGNGGGRPHVPAPMESECKELHETLRLLVATLGHPLFEDPVQKAERSDDTSEVKNAVRIPGAVSFYCKGEFTDATGKITNDGFVVEADSLARLKPLEELAERERALRLSLIAQGVIEERGGYQYRFLKPYHFRSASAASGFVLGRSSNGWVDWKDAQGRTLDEIERRKVAASGGLNSEPV